MKSELYKNQKKKREERSERQACKTRREPTNPKTDTFFAAIAKYLLNRLLHISISYWLFQLKMVILLHSYWLNFPLLDHNHIHYSQLSVYNFHMRLKL